MRIETYCQLINVACVCVLSVIILACSPNRASELEFRKRLDALHSGSVRFRNADEEIDYLSAQILAEQDSDRKAVMFTAYSNTVINAPIVSTNNIKREQYLRRGIITGPYKYAVRGYREFVNSAFEKVGVTNTFDHFCIELEIWKRLDRELTQCEALMEIVAQASVEYGQEALADDYKNEAKMSLTEEKHEIEYSLERYYRRESGESRRAYELFREVVGHEAKTRYRH